MSPAQKLQYLEIRKKAGLKAWREAGKLREAIRLRLIANGEKHAAAAKLSWELMIAELATRGIINLMTCTQQPTPRAREAFGPDACADVVQDADGADGAVHDATP